MSATNTVIVQSDENRSTSEKVINAVAETTGTDPTRMTPLYDVVDPDALDRLFDPQSRRPGSGVRVVFTFESCEVTVEANGRVVVTPPSRRVDADSA